MGIFGRGDRGNDAKGPQQRGGAPTVRARANAAGTDGRTRAKEEHSSSRGEGFGSTGRSRSGRAPTSKGDAVANIGKSIIVKGELTGDEDLEIEGTVEGDVKLPNHVLTIGAHGHVKAEVTAKCVQVVGHVAGNVIATERVEIQASGVVEGDIHAPRLLVQEGAVVNGSIQMSPDTAPAAVSNSTTSAIPARKAG